MVDTTSSITFQADTSQISTATRTLNANAAAAQGVQQQATQTGRSYRNLGNIAGQAGFQIQDATVQLQMGTSAMVVLAQQGSQFAGAFGPMGAVVGAFIAIGATVVGTFLPSLFKSTDAVKDLTEAMKALEEISTEIEPNIFELSEALDLLAERSEVAAEAAIRSAVIKGRKDIKTAIDGLEKITNDFTDRFGVSALFSTLAEGTLTEAKIIRNANVLRKQSVFGNVEDAKEFSRAFLEFGKAGKSVESIGNLRLSIDQLFNSIVKPSDEFLAFRDNLAKLDDVAQKAGAEVGFLSDKATKLQSGQAGLTGRVIDPFEGLEERNGSFVDAEQEMADQLAEINRKAAEEQRKLDEKSANERIRTAHRVARERIRSERMIASGVANIGNQIAEIIGQNAEEGSTAAKLAYGITQAIQVAQAFNSANVAYAGVIASAAAIPDPTGAVLAAGIARAELIRGLGYASAALIAGNSIGTLAGRAQGGQVRAGEAYRVGEYGPETLIMGNQGGFVSNKSQSGASVEIVNNVKVIGGSGNAQVETKTTQVSDAKFVQDIVIREMGNQNSPSRRALSSNSNVKSVGTR